MQTIIFTLQKIIQLYYGHPATLEETHGVGSKSVIAFVKKYDGELMYKAFIADASVQYTP